MPVAKREQLKGSHYVSKSSRSFTSCAPKQQLRDSSLNVGVGAGALYILITCQEEMKMLNKTVEETENLVQELKHELQHCGEDLGSHHACSVRDRSFSKKSSNVDSDCRGRQSISTSKLRLDELLEEHVPAMRGLAKDQMAALADELEAELELMELNIKADESVPFETVMHDAGEVLSKGVSNSYYSDTSSHGVLEGSGIGRPSAQLGASHVDYGVSAVELDHRLREVLEAQQQDRILELEQLLEETKAKLLAKEQEIFCWKNHVHSLSKFLQPHSTCGTVVCMYNNFVAALPEATKSSVKLLQPLQDPPISTEANYLNAISLSDTVADVSIHETTSPQSNKVFMSASPFFKSSRDVKNTMGKFECYLEGTGIDIPEYVIMKETEKHTSGQNSEVFESEVSTSICNVEEDDAPSELRISRPHCCVHDNVTPSDTTGLEISRLHGMQCRLASDSPEEELDMDSDVKYVVNSIMPKRSLLEKYHENFDREDIHMPERSMQSSKKSLQFAKKGWKESQGQAVDVTSPVLAKIRHYEALGGHAREEHSI
ncbi:hypothetical protein L7F22_037294 [Adiantum nelumboides]|nr:hypothetical protein [Adiantum nelumboides]